MRGSKRLASGFVLAAFCCGLVFAFAAAQGDENGGVEEQLRSALRDAVLKARNLEDQNASLQAQQMQAERERAEIARKYADDEKELAGLRQRATTAESARRTESAAAQQNISKLQSAYQQASTTASGLQGDIQRMTAAADRLHRQIDACAAKNEQLYWLGHQVLELYDHKGLLDVAGEAEPLTQLRRIETEKTAQDYEDKLRANRQATPPANGATP
jgi:chromosome segregation ATPase